MVVEESKLNPNWAPVTELRRMNDPRVCRLLSTLILMSSHNCHVLNAYRVDYAYILVSDSRQANPSRSGIRRPMAVSFG